MGVKAVFPFVFFGIFLFFTAVDVVGHRRLKARRSLPQWGLLAAVVLLGACSLAYGAAAVLGPMRAAKANLYLAYQYLLDGDGAAARLKAQALPDGLAEARQISLFADCVDGDFVNAYFTSGVLEEEGASGGLREAAGRVRALCAGQLGLEGEALSGQEAGEAAQREIAAAFAALPYADAERAKYAELYRLDRLVSRDGAGELSREDVEALERAYPGDTDVLRLLIKYHMLHGRYGEAADTAARLLEADGGAQSRIIYTDVVAQAVREGGTLYAADDPEAAGLLARAQALEDEAARFGQSGDQALLEKQQERQNEARALRKRAQNLDIHRAINYLISKRPLLSDRAGLYEMQIAKLYLAADDLDRARESVARTVRAAAALPETSPLKKPLTGVVDAYNQLAAGGEGGQLLEGAVRTLVRAQSQDVVPVAQGTVNGDFANFMASTLKYDRITVHIGRIDTANYPTVRAYANINAEKEGIFGLAGNFGEKDFELIDTQYMIRNFHLVKDEMTRAVSIAIVMDCSGSMAGRPLADAKLAAQSCVEKMDAQSQRLAVVAYNNAAATVAGLTRSAPLLTGGIDSLTASGGTNIAAGLQEGLNALGGGGAGAVILLSDGRDGGSKEAMAQAVERARRENVSVYAVGFGDVNEETMRAIAEDSGGKFILAANSTELSDIYLTLQKYIVNNYCFEYTVTENPGADPRALMVRVPAYQTSDTRRYSVHGDPGQAPPEGTGAPDGFRVDSVAPGGVSSGDVLRGVEVLLTGGGFTEGMRLSIGGVALQEVSVKDAATATGVLMGSLKAGRYEVSASLPDGRTFVGDGLFSVFVAGSTRTVRLGSTTLSADRIGQTGDKTFVAAGNVLINRFLHSGAPVTIEVDDLPEGFDIAQSDSPRLGSKGEISGEGRLTISYSTASRQHATFASLAMGGRDYVVSKGRFAMNIDRDENDFSVDVLDPTVDVPNIGKIEFGKAVLYADRLQLDVRRVHIKDIVEQVQKGISGGKGASSAAKEAAAGRGGAAQQGADKPQKREEAFAFSPLKTTDLSLSFALTPDDIKVGLELGVHPNDSLRFGQFFGINAFNFKLNTLDGGHQYWLVSGDIDFSHIVKGFGGTGVEGLSTELSSHYWYPDKLKIKADLNPGIPLYKILYLDELGGEATGLSQILMALGGVNPEQEDLTESPFTLSALFGADVNLFKTLNVSNKELLEWGELGAIKNGEISLQFTEFTFRAKADMELFKQKLADAELSLGVGGLTAKAGVQAELSGFGMGLGGRIAATVHSTLESGYLEIGVNGHIDCDWTNTHLKGQGKAKFELEYDGSYICASVSDDRTLARVWYDKEGSVVFFDGFHAEVVEL